MFQNTGAWKTTLDLINLSQGIFNLRKIGDAYEVNINALHPVTERLFEVSGQVLSEQMRTNQKWGGCPYQPLTATCNSGELIRVLVVVLSKSGKRNVSRRKPIGVSSPALLQSGMLIPQSMPPAIKPSELSGVV